MDKLELRVVDYLSKFSIIAEKINECDKKTPDFLINQEETILIELKEKLDRDELYENKEAILEEGEIYQHIGNMGYKNRISGVIGEGITQLETQRINTNSDFCLLFIVASGVAPSNQIQQTISTLYGRKSIIDYDSDSNHAVDCYYAYYSDFFKHKNTLDGVILVADRITFLLVNSCSPRYREFRSSVFYSKFIDKVRIIDPVELEALGEIMIADCDIGRKEQELVKEYVFSKYGIVRGLMIDFPQYIMQSRIDT